MGTFGVAITVPEPYGAALQGHRAGFGDPMAEAIPPHVTLLPPTEIVGPAVREFTDHLTAVVAMTVPFEMRLAGTGTFRPVSPVVFVQVSQGIPECERLEAAIRSGPGAARPRLQLPPARHRRPPPRRGRPRRGLPDAGGLRVRGSPSPRSTSTSTALTRCGACCATSRCPGTTSPRSPGPPPSATDPAPVRDGAPTPRPRPPRPPPPGPRPAPARPPPGPRREEATCRPAVTAYGASPPLAVTTKGREAGGGGGAGGGRRAESAVPGAANAHPEPGGGPEQRHSEQAAGEEQRPASPGGRSTARTGPADPRPCPARTGPDAPGSPGRAPADTDGAAVGATGTSPGSTRRPTGVTWLPWAKAQSSSFTGSAQP